MGMPRCAFLEEVRLGKKVALRKSQGKKNWSGKSRMHGAAKHRPEREAEARILAEPCVSFFSFHGKLQLVSDFLFIGFMKNS